MKKWKKVNQESFIFGDFDNDNVKNIDDPFPFDKNKKKHPKEASYYHKSRYGDPLGEVKLSTQLRAIEQYNNQRSPLLKKFIKQNPGSFGRIKTVPSTIRKMRLNYQPQIKDLAAVTVLTDKRAEVLPKVKEIKRKYANEKKDNNYYASPKDDVYFAHHLFVVEPKKRDRRLEVQVKSKRMNELHKEMHYAYKKEGNLSKFKKKALKLFKQGY